MLSKYNLKFKAFLTKYNFYKTGYNEKSENLFLTSSFCFLNSYQAEFFFKNSNIYYIYSRFNNPIFYMLQNKLILLEKSKYCILLSSGMSSIATTLISILEKYNIIITSNNLFSSSFNFIINIISKFNIFNKIINYNNINFILNNIFYKIKIFFLETPTNPLIKIFDIKNIYYIIKKYYNIYFIIDNTLLTPISQNPIVVGCDILIHSCTKFMDGQGKVLGGAIITSDELIYKKIFNYIKVTGPILSVFNCWVILKSIETIFLRFKNQSKNTYIISNLLKKNIFLINLMFSGIFEFKQFKLLKYQQLLKNIIISFQIKGITLEMRRINSWKIINNLNTILLTANLGDLNTIITHPASTTHNSISLIEKKLLGICDSCVRISLGSEDIYNIYTDLIISFLFF